jgi:hypothetical protein
MTAMEVSPSKKRLTLMTIWGVSNIQQRMLRGCFEGYIVNKYGSYNVYIVGTNTYIVHYLIDYFLGHIL